MTKNLETSKEVPKRTEALLDAYKSKDEINETQLDVKAIESNKRIYKILNDELKKYIHSLQILIR
mgnify:CR=1 FL=1